VHPHWPRNRTKSSNGNTGSASLVAVWAYNNEVQVANVTYPNRFEGLFQSQRLVTHRYDSMARLNSVQTKLGTENQQNPGRGQSELHLSQK
jgi:L-fucose isomerase-like protein